MMNNFFVKLNYYILIYLFEFTHKLPIMDIVLSSITKDLGDIILSYCTFDSYKKLYRINPTLYNFNRYEILLLKKFKEENRTLLKYFKKYKSLHYDLFSNKCECKRWNIIRLFVTSLILNNFYNKILKNLCQTINILFANKKNVYNSACKINLIYLNNDLTIYGINLYNIKRDTRGYIRIYYHASNLYYEYTSKRDNSVVLGTFKSTSIWNYLKNIMKDYYNFLQNVSSTKGIYIYDDCNFEIRHITHDFTGY
jgi:hypothetical protein